MSKRKWHAAAAVGIVVMLAGCQSAGVEADITLDDAEMTTTSQVDAMIARIDPALIERIDKVTNESSGCRGEDVDPEQRVRQWENRRFVVFVESVQPAGGLEILDELVTAQVGDGWYLSRDRPERDGTVRRVQLFSPVVAGNESDGIYGINIAGGGDAAGPISLNISGVSPCFEVPEGES